MQKSIFTFLILLIGINQNMSSQYRMPEETEQHEGTWLQWPHHYTYGVQYRNELDPTWLSMTNALIGGEKVHIVAYDNMEKNRIIGLLNNASIPLTNIDFLIHQNDDVWVRDNGPIFVYDNNNNLAITDWGFNGWGNDATYAKDDVIPQGISTDINVPRIDLSAMVLEGGAIEIDGNGTIMATRSSVTHSSRNPGLTEAQIENYMTTYLGITNFIWLDGVYGLDITDMHIDGFVKFANDSTIVTMNSTDLTSWSITPAEQNIINTATDVNNDPYNIVIIPLTQNNVITTYSNNLGYKGSYCNYYIGNNAVLVPIYNDPNDAVALNIIQGIYPNRTVVGIDVRDLYASGGMVHCVTQQQPIAINPTTIQEKQKPSFK